MNAKQLISEVSRAVIGMTGYTDTEILTKINQTMGDIAREQMLPGLSSGHDTVQTVVGAYVTDLPDDFHKGIYLARDSDGVFLSVLKSLQNMVMECGLSTDNPFLSAVAVDGGKLFYQGVPSTASDIELFYYRKPTPMTDSDTSFPDGLTSGELLALDNAIIHGTVWPIWHIVERGEEGQKPNTQLNKVLHEEAMADLKTYCIREGINYPAPQFNKVY